MGWPGPRRCGAPAALVLLLLLLTALTLEAQGQQAQRRPVPGSLQIGFHLSPLRAHPVTGDDFGLTSTREFLDLMRHSTPFSEGVEHGLLGFAGSWVGYNIPQDLRPRFRPDGYPAALGVFQQSGGTRQISVKATIGEGGAFVADGEYLARWQGAGNISWEGDASLLNTTANSAYVLVQPSQGVVVRIVATDQTDPLRNLSLVPAAFASIAEVFHPQFLQTLRGASIIRFSGWQQVDAWDGPSSMPRSWATRSLPSDQTQAGPLGVCVEYMVLLANLLGADPWFSMPKAARAGPGVTDPYATSFAALVRTLLRPDLKVYVEYRSCCANGLAPGWGSQEYAAQSATAWASWAATWDPGRIVNVASSLPQADKFGPDVGRVEAAAIDVSFGDLCAYGESPCIPYDATDAYWSYGTAKPEALVQTVLWPAMLRRESEVNAAVQRALLGGFQLLAFNALPLASARGLGHRATLRWALRCEECLMRQLGRRYGTRERARHMNGSYVLEEDFIAFLADQGLAPEDRVSSSQYWLQVPPELAQAQCNAMADCAGFTYVKAGEWSCGAGGTNRYGDCAVPGTAYFFNGRRTGRGVMRPPTSCSAYTVPGSEDCAPGRVDTYFKRDTRSQAAQDAAEEAALDACDECQPSFGQLWYTWNMPPSGFTLDQLRAVLPQLIANAAQEQTLEQNMIEALQTDAASELMLNYLERLRRLGFSAAVAGPLHRQPRICRAGGKVCGAGALRAHPDDDSAVWRAFGAYQRGVRALPPAPPAEVPPCPQPCVYGVCEAGSCRCWARASGPECAQLDPSGRCEHPMGLSLSSVGPTTREWVFVDVFKQSGVWASKQFSASFGGGGGALQLRGDGYPAYLAVNQVAQVLTLRDLERHYTDGWYTVLYDGEGILDFGMDVTAVRRIAPGMIRVYLDLRTLSPSNGLSVRISQTREENPVRNIRVVSPGFDATSVSASPFHPAFKESLRRFTVLRFAGWMLADPSGAPWRWGQRPTPGYYSQGTPKGVSLEHMVLLANEMGANPWFSLPISATDTYVTSFANYVAENLRPDIQEVYVELGREVWNSASPDSLTAEQQGSNLEMGGLCWYARRSGEVAEMARGILEPQRRLTVVAGSKASDPDVTQQLLACRGISSVNAIGLAPSFDGIAQLGGQRAALDAVLASYASAATVAVQAVQEHKVLLADTQFRLVAYEAGPSGPGAGAAADVALKAHRDPRMQSIVKDYLDALSQVVDLIVYHPSCGLPTAGSGPYGLIEAMDQPRDKAPNYLAVAQFLDARSSCGASVVGCQASSSCSGNGICGTDGNCYCYVGFSGPSCLPSTSGPDHVSCGDDCSSGQGTCNVTDVLGGVRSWSCSCSPDYGGTACASFECPDGCNQRGHCVASGVCSCFRGFRGASCEVDCGCSNHGQCGPGDQCICDRGWRRVQGGGCEWDCETADTSGCAGPGQPRCRSCAMGSCIGGACRCWAGFAGPNCTALNASLLSNPGVFGINVAITPSTFLDVMKTASEWISVWNGEILPGQFAYQSNGLAWDSRQPDWGNGQPVVQSDAGDVQASAPDQALVTRTLRDVCLHVPKGRYTVLYDGDADVDVGGDGSPLAFQKGRIDVDFDPTCRRECWLDKQTWAPNCSDRGLALVVRRVNPDDPVRGIRVVMPGFSSTFKVQPFHPFFLKQLERFAFVRLATWGKVNEEAFVKRTPIPVKFLRFTSLSTKGGGVPRVAELMLRGPAGEMLPCTSAAAPEICDGDLDTDWAPARRGVASGGESIVVELVELAQLASYMWVTSGWQQRVDPVSWVLESSWDNSSWSQLDMRSTRQQVTFNRRRPAALETPEGATWYPIRLPTDLMQWADRNLPAYRSQTLRPVAMEYQVLLVNTLGAAPWVCVHHLASDDYVRQEATYWLNNLRPDVKVYVEHSSEVWNPSLPQGRFAAVAGANLGLLAAGGCKTETDLCARVRYNARRSRQIFDIWKSVWAVNRSRLLFVLSTQTGRLDTTRDLLSIDRGSGADLLGIGAFMAPRLSVDPSYATKSVGEVIDLFTAGIDSARVLLRQQIALAQAQGMGVAAYDGGVALVEPSALDTGEATGAVTELLIAAGRSAPFKAAVQAWLDMYRAELGDAAPFAYGPDAGFWSKRGQAGLREFYAAATAASPAAAAVHAHLDQRYGPRPACVLADSMGRGLPPDSFLGPPAVWRPSSGSVLVVGSWYRLQWALDGLQNVTLDFLLWRRTSCAGSASTRIGSANSLLGRFIWQVPDLPPDGGYFVELRPRAPAQLPSNYSSFFSIVSAENASVDYLLSVERSQDLIAPFRKDCKRDGEWAIRDQFKVDSCVLSAVDGCREYRSTRKSLAADGPAPWRHGSGRTVKDCTLHSVRVRQTFRVEGLSAGLGSGSAVALARLVASASGAAPGSVSISVLGTEEDHGRRLSSTMVDLALTLTTDDSGMAAAAIGVSTLQDNRAFLRAAAALLKEPDLQIAATGGVYVEDAASGRGAEPNYTTTSFRFTNRTTWAYTTTSYNFTTTTTTDPGIGNVTSTSTIPQGYITTIYVNAGRRSLAPARWSAAIACAAAAVAGALHPS